MQVLIILIIFWKKLPCFEEQLAVVSQLAHDVVATLGFGCILVATPDDVVTTLSQHCVYDVITTTKN